MVIVKNGCAQSDYGTLKLTVSSMLVFLHAVTNSKKLKADSMIFEWAWSKMAVIF